MRTVTAAQRASLRNGVKLVTLCKFKLGNVFRYISNEDVHYTFDGNVYLPSYLKDVDDIEVGSTPRIEDSDVTIDGSDSTFIGLFLSQNWMNNPLTLIQLYIDLSGQFIMSKIAYEGLMSEVSISTENSYEVQVTVSSIWKDFKKTAGIKTNPTSQQIHYPNDTGFEHVAKATKTTPWGKSGDGRSVISNSQPGVTRFPRPNHDEP